MIDTHCHMNLSHFEDDFDVTLAHAVMDGIEGFVNIGYDPETARATESLVERFPFFYGVVGVHPHDAPVLDDAYEKTLRRLLDHPRIVAVGEVGLDYYRDLSPRDVQRDTFRRMIRLAREKDMPIVIHCRDAFDDVVGVLAGEGGSYRGIFHAFGGDDEAARRVIDLGFHIGIGGPVSYRNSRLGRTLESIPIERIVLETDAPYLPPHPYRGNRNEPAFVAHVARTVARIYGESVEEVIRATTENFVRAFGIDSDRLPGPVYRIAGKVYVHPAKAGPDDLAGYTDLKGVDEMILCGFAEPLLDLDRALTLAEAGKKAGWRVRVNTIGSANHIHERDVTKELADVVDEIVVIYYGTTAVQHERIVMSGDNQSFEIMKDFTRCSVLARIDTLCEFIAVPKFSPEACREFAKELGAQYDIRMYRS